nr:zinc finger BED domain-containing protein RICESLEEPER 4-like [Solanum lycopersicum]
MAENISTDEVVILGDESINSNAMRQTQSVQPKVTKERKRRSRAWDNYGTFVDEEGNKKAKCKHCGQDYFADSVKNGTKAMLTHMLTCPKMPKVVDKSQTQIGFQSVQEGNTCNVIVVSRKFEQEQCRRALCRMVIVDELPFKFVEKEGFKNFMKVAQPHFKIPSRTTMTRDCFKFYNEEKQKLKRVFGEARQKVCLTTDTWTSLQQINYMCITAHWIDNEWIMHKRIISFCPISSHKGENMANEIIKCLHDWGLDIIFTITVDNASSNDVTVKELSKMFTKRGINFMNGEHLHVRCIAHILNLAVQDGLKMSVVSIERVRKAVKYIRLSPARCKRFQKCCEDVDINCKKSLSLDVSTRWNSTYLMLNRAIEFESAFSSYSARDISLLHYLKFVEDEDGKDENGSAIGALLSDDWDNVRKIANFLQIFYEYERISFALQMMFGKEAPILEKRVGDYMELLFGEYVKSLSKDKGSQHSSSLSSSSFENSSSLLSSSGSVVQSIGSLGTFMGDLMKHKTENTTTVKTALQKYFAEENEVESKNFNILSWWKINSPRFSVLAEMARNVLAIPISSVAFECAFSTGGRILDSFRSSLTPKLVQTLVCLQDWIKSESRPISVEEDIDVLEQLEQDLANTNILDE